MVLSMGRLRAMTGLFGVGWLAQAAAAQAAEAQADVSVDASLAASTATAAPDPGKLLVAGKIGGLASFNGLDPFPTVGVEVGYVFGGTDGRIAALLAGEYTAPSASGDRAEAFAPERIPDGAYSWELRQKELVLQPTFMFRLTGLVPQLTPYAGVGPRVYLLESVVRGRAGAVSFQDTTERSTKFGVGVPLGAELELGPGGLFAEFLLQWAPVDHATTGDTHLGGSSLYLGYRAAI